jgi:rRNA maturation RNase YbeY
MLMQKPAREQGRNKPFDNNQHLSMIDVINLQRKVKLDTKQFREFVNLISSTVDEVHGKTFSVAFVSDDRMWRLNWSFRGKDSTTDVLSFPNEPAPHEESDFLGDVVVSADQAARQAKENKLSLENEIKQLILHSVLHLCGYDHESDDGEMNARELELRQLLNI